jgi:hypothetical protein
MWIVDQFFKVYVFGFIFVDFMDVQVFSPSDFGSSCISKYCCKDVQIHTRQKF